MFFQKLHYITMYTPYCIRVAYLPECEADILTNVWPKPCQDAGRTATFSHSFVEDILR